MRTVAHVVFKALALDYKIHQAKLNCQLKRTMYANLHYLYIYEIIFVYGKINRKRYLF